MSVGNRFVGKSVGNSLGKSVGTAVGRSVGSRSRVLLGLAAATLVVGVAGFAAPADAALTGANAVLTRAPYLSDLTTSSVRVSWMTSTQFKGVVKYGPTGNCAASTATSATLGNPLTVGTVREYFNSIQLPALAAGAGYCYRVYDGAATDLMGSLPSGSFTTLDAPSSSAPLTFAVFADTGDTTHGIPGATGTVNDGSLNVNQANLMSRLATSGARFAVSVGDIAYPSGSQTNYGDVNQTGANTSGIFGPSYWTVAGSALPLYAVSGNHGKNNTYLTTWPTTTVAAATQPKIGQYAMLPYPSFNGTVADSYPTSYYAFTTGGTRFYMLDAAWSNSNVGQATGGACGTSTSCKIYEVDAAAHWTAASDQYTWLAADLAAHPSERKLAFFHFPLRSDDNNQPGDTFLQNTAGSSGSLEQLLRDGGVRLAFNGHSHTYQRFVPPPGGLASYVTGGGGALATTVGDKGCSSLNAYGIGWTYGSNKGKACGAAVASPPTSDAQVYHYLKVSLSGTRATVTPISSAGQAFDPVTYELGPDSTPPSAPGSLAFTRPTTTSVALTWTPASDAGGVVAYDVYRDGARLTTLPATKTAYTDTTAAAGGQYTYRVDARDLAGNVGPASVAVGGPGPDTSAPSAPASLTSTAQSPTSVALSWTASSDNVAVTGYTITRNGVVVATTAGTVTSYSDTTVAPSTTYAYTVKASDAAGNVSNASPTASATTPPALPPPTTLFADDFESNGLTAWTANSGLSTVGTGAHTGTFAARASSAGTATSAYKTLPSTYTELWGQTWFNVTSKSTSVNLVGFNRATGANILVAYLDASNRVSVRNNAGLVTTNSTTTVAPGSWHRLVLHAVVNGTTSSFDVALDGVPVPGLTLTGQNLGTSAIGRLQLGDTSTARTYDVLLDDVVASSTSF